MNPEDRIACALYVAFVLLVNAGALYIAGTAALPAAAMSLLLLALVLRRAFSHN